MRVDRIEVSPDTVDALVDTAARLIDSGWTEDEVVEVLADGADALVDWTALGGPVGALIETYDGPAVSLLLSLLASMFDPDPSKKRARLTGRAERAEDRGNHARGERLRKRAARLE